MIRVRALRMALPDCPKGGVSFDLPDGEITGLIDPKGAYASALLRLLAGLSAVDADELNVAGIDAAGSPEALRELVGYLGPDPVCLGESLRDDLTLVAALRSVDRAVVDGVLELMDLSAVSDVPFSSLSRSQRLRLGLARLLLHDPSVLLLDEPFAHLDPAGRDELSDQLAELSRMGKTVVIHTQCTERLDGLCHRLISLDASGLRADHAPESP